MGTGKPFSFLNYRIIFSSLAGLTSKVLVILSSSTKGILFSFVTLHVTDPGVDGGHHIGLALNVFDVYAILRHSQHCRHGKALVMVFFPHARHKRTDPLDFIVTTVRLTQGTCHAMFLQLIYLFNSSMQV